MTAAKLDFKDQDALRAEQENEKFLSYGFDTAGYSMACPKCNIRKSFYSSLHSCWICLNCGNLFKAQAKTELDDWYAAREEAILSMQCPWCMCEEVRFDQLLDLWHCLSCNYLWEWEY